MKCCYNNKYFSFFLSVYKQIHNKILYDFADLKEILELYICNFKVFYTSWNMTEHSISEEHEL